MTEADRNDELEPSPRWLVWYPVVAVLVVALVIFLTTGGAEEETTDAALATAALPVPAGIGERAQAAAPDEQAAEVASPLRWSLESAEELSSRAGLVAGLFGERIGRLTGELGDQVAPERMLERGRVAARFVPFAGPYLRYHRARLLWASELDAEREAAKRQTVVALAELALDAGSAGLGKAASDSEGLAVALAGAVDLADFMDTAISIHELLGDPLQLEGLVAATRSVDDLAGLALVNVEGLDGFVVTLLELDPEDATRHIPAWAPELALRLGDELGLER